jgi:hypothetical protein
MKCNLFGVDANTTVLLDKPCLNLLKQKAEIVVNPAINAHDAYQIIIHATEDINEYFVETSDLINGKGDVLSNECVEIYHCKYTLVKTNVEKFYNLGEGYYPNAILPIQAAVEYGENKVKKGQSQSVYFSFYIPENTKVGVYKGNFTLCIDGEDIFIPVQVNIKNVRIPKENHLRTMFLTEWDWHGPSKVREFSKYQRYTNLLSKYRLNVSTLIPYPQEDELEYLYGFHADLAYEYCLNPLHTTFAIPYRNWIKRREVDGGIKGSQSELLMGLECDVFENFLVALIKKSLEKNFNIIKRAVVHFGRFIDEPQGQGTMDRLERTHREYREILERLSGDLLKNSDSHVRDYGTTQEFIAEISDSVYNLPHVITTHYHEKYDAFIDTYCPLFWIYQIEDSFDEYNHKKEKWWYGCNGPTSPCPTYHLDDHLLSPRILSWLQYKYGYIGNLFWAVNCYNYQNAGAHEYYDFHSEINCAGQVNLDGLLCYPGEIYGLEENVATLRMEEIRAGMEDYEILYSLGNAYEKCGVSLKETFAYYMTFLSRGIKIIGDNEVFATIRKIVFDLYELHFETGLCVCDLREENGMLNGRILLNKEYSLSCEYADLACETFSGMDMYTFSLPTACAHFLVSGNGAERFFELGNVSSNTIIDAKHLINELSDIDSNVEFVYSSEQGIQLILPTEKGLIQTFKLAIPQTLELHNAVSLSLSFDNQKDEKKFEGINIQAKFEKEAGLRTMLSRDTYMPPLRSSMPIYLSNNDWEKSGKLEYLVISFGEDNEEHKLLSEKTPVKKYIWLQSMEIIYKK